MNNKKRIEQIVKTAAISGAIVLILFSVIAMADATGAKGIDIASTQHPGNKLIDWQKVYNADIRFAWAKADEGTYNVDYTDKFFKEDMEKGEIAAVKMGAYHFARPVKYSPEKEAQHFVNTAKDYLKDGYLRPAVDIESYDPTGENPCTEKVVGANSLTNWIHTYMDAVKKQTDVEPLIYTGHFARESCFDSSITKYNLWFSQYSPGPNTGIWPNWDFWQYSDNGRVDDIGDGKTTPVDLDVLNGPESDLDKYVIHKPTLVSQSVYPASVEAGNELTFAYTVKNPFTYALDYTILKAQIRKSNSKDNWIDISDSKIINLIQGTHDYTRKFEIPTTVAAGSYDVKWIILNSMNGNQIDSAESVNALEIKSSVSIKPTITVVSPDTGEVWERGSLHNIVWTSTGNPGGLAKIELLKNSIVVKSIPTFTPISEGSYFWNVPTDLVSEEDYQIRVTSSDNPDYTDTSDGYFTIGSLLTVTSPNGGENWQSGGILDVYPIEWTYIGDVGSTLKIELFRSLTDTTAAYVITDSTPVGSHGQGSYTWVIPSDVLPGNYLIKITSNEKPEFTDTSDSHFTISQGVCIESASTAIKTALSATCILPSKPKLDLAFLIDTTSSMTPYIDAVKASASEIVGALDSKGLDSRIAIADYRDYPELPYGGATDYIYNLSLPFSKDKDSIISSINGLNLGWGADTPEAVYSALVHTMQDQNKDPLNSANFGWRKGVTKVIIQMGDAPPHMPKEPWSGGYSLNDVISTSKSIDPVIVYSVAIGSDKTAYSAFSEIANGTGGKVYTSPTASDIVATIIEAIGDIGKPTTSYGVSVNITPALNETSPGGSVSYSVNITNQGNVNDTYNLSLDLKSFTGFYQAYPVAIQSSWVDFNRSSVELDPSISAIRPLAINIPNNWAGMADVTYDFNVTAKSETDVTISNTSSAQLKVKANKKSMAEYSKLETQWLSKLVNGSGIDQGIKNALLAKLANADSKLDQAITNIDGGNMKSANNMLNASQNTISAFINQVEAQYDKKIMQPDATILEEKASQILQDIEKAKNA